MGEQQKISKTGLLTEEYFRVVAEYELIRRKRYPNPVALIFMSPNLDKAKPESTKNLKQFSAGVLNTSLRVSDIPGHYGDDFLVLLPGTDGVGCQIAAKRLISSLGAKPDISDEKSLEFRVHIGMTSHPSGEDTSADNLIHEAELALNEARAAGSTGFKVFSG